jgi:outer membrane biosynthesis protein TonB
MRLKSWITFGFPLLLLSVFSPLNKLTASQADSKKAPAASEDLTSVAHASCGFQATEVMVLDIPGTASPIATVKCDEVVTIIYDEVGFYKVRLSNGAQGYISHAFIADSNEKPPVSNGTHESIARAGASGTVPPSCMHCPDPKFTREARSAKRQGIIILEVIISTDGKATSVRAIQVRTLDKQVIGAQYLDRAWVSLEETAIDSVRKWQFKPAYGSDGKPLTVLTPLEMTFRLV